MCELFGMRIRGLKSTVWEGGVRGAGFIWSPLFHHSAYTSHHLIHITDWLPTLLHAVTNDPDDFRLPENLDGIDQWDVLSKNRKESQRKEILHNIDPQAEAAAVRVSDMKMVVAAHGSTRWYDGWYPTSQGRRDEDGTVLEAPYAPYDACVDGDMNIQSTKTNITYQKSLWSSSRDHRSKYSSVRPPHLSEMAPPSDSELTSLLEKLGRKPRYRQEPLVVKCGRRPANASTNCKPWIHACLFNVTADPCEYDNLASSQPDVLTEMQKRLQFYKDHSAPPLNKPVDDAGLPYHHNWNWVPWRKDPSQTADGT